MTPAPTAADRIMALADACVQCGLCLPHCPTYALDRRETESPRGRIALMKALAAGTLEDGPGTSAALDHCLACRACERACPARVEYGALLVASRAQRRAARPAPLRQRMLEWLLPRAAPRDAAFRVLRWLWPLLPRRWRRVPPPPRVRAVARRVAAAGARRGRVALFAGCLGGSWEASSVRAATQVLSRLGWDVEVISEPGCCGALQRHAGHDVAAAAQAQRLRTRAWPDTDAVLTLASGCHEAVQAALCTDGAPKVYEAIAFVAQDPALAPLLRPASAPIALHLPCTQRHVSGSAGAMLPLLRDALGLAPTVVGASGCCGAAGSHMLDFPSRAAALRAPLLDATAACGAATLCSANVGCRMHLDAGARERGLALRVLHPIELLAEHLA